MNGNRLPATVCRRTAVEKNKRRQDTRNTVSKTTHAGRTWRHAGPVQPSDSGCYTRAIHPVTRTHVGIGSALEMSCTPRSRQRATCLSNVTQTCRLRTSRAPPGRRRRSRRPTPRVYLFQSGRARNPAVIVLVCCGRCRLSALSTSPPPPPAIRLSVATAGRIARAGHHPPGPVESSRPVSRAA